MNNTRRLEAPEHLLKMPQKHFDRYMENVIRDVENLINNKKI